MVKVDLTVEEVEIILQALDYDIGSTEALLERFGDNEAKEQFEELIEVEEEIMEKLETKIEKKE